jgi:multicomponent Na+:H+ antiporter subunit E
MVPVYTREFLLLGLFVAGPVTVALNRYALGDLPEVSLDPRRWFYFLVYLAILTKGIVLAGVLLARVILRRDVSIRPAVVAVPTLLRKRWELTLLANSITLTPGTFFLDLDEENGTMYVHWISIKSEGVDEVKQMITERYERILSKVFE